ncbi:MAG: alpha/beta hydrolase [Pseudomonadota bacterium]
MADYNVMSAMSADYQEFTFLASDALKLYGRKFGWDNPDPTPVVCLAGLTRNSDDFDSVARFLASEEGGSRRVVSFDYRGRGKSEYDPNWQNYDLLKETEDVLAGLTALGLEHVNILGTSRGGLIAMIIGAARPGILASVILNDIGPEINVRGLVRIRKSLEARGKPKSLKEAAAALQSAFGKDFPNLEADDWHTQATRLFAEENGKLVTRYDGNVSRSLSNINLDAPLETMWPQFKGLSSIPCMLIHGKLSDLLTDDIVDKMRSTHPNLVVLQVHDQAHAPLLEDETSQQAIRQFLAGVK